MDKYEYKLKLDQLKSLVEEKDYKTAAEIADTINWRKVRSAATLCMVGEIYDRCKRYEESHEILLMAYDRAAVGRNILYRLTLVSLKMGNLDEAKDYYEDFLDVAPYDNQKYILRYEIEKMSGADLPHLISILEEFKEREYREEWAFELAYLYHKIGDSERCVEVCDELILWIGDGKYVEKALELKMLYQPLTLTQEEKYREFMQRKEGAVKVHTTDKLESGEVVQETMQIPRITANTGRFNTQNLQAEIAKSMQQIMDANTKETVSDTMDNLKKIVEDIPYLQVPAEDSGRAVEDERYGHIETDEEIDDTLRNDFAEMLAEDWDGQISFSVQGGGTREPQVNGQIGIEEVLADWEKTRIAAETAMAAAQQKRLESAKARAMQEAWDLLERLHDIIPKLEAGVSPKELLEEQYLQNVSSEKQGIEEGAQIPEDIQIPEEVQIPQGIQIPEEVRMLQNTQIPEDIQMSENMPVLEGMQMPESVPLSEDMQMPESMPLPEDIRMPERVVMPEEMKAPEDIRMPERVVMPEEMQAPEDIRMPERVPLSEDMQMPESMPLPKDIRMPESVPTPEDVQTSEDVQALGDTRDMREISDSISAWEEAAKILGEPIPEEYLEKMRQEAAAKQKAKKQAATRKPVGSALPEEATAGRVVQAFATNETSQEATTSGIVEEATANETLQEAAASGIAQEPAASGIAEEFATSGIAEESAASGMSQHSATNEASQVHAGGKTSQEFACSEPAQEPTGDGNAAQEAGTSAKNAAGQGKVQSKEEEKRKNASSGKGDAGQYLQSVFEAAKASREEKEKVSVPKIEIEEPQEHISKLSPEQKKIFSYFVPISGMEQQLCQVLEGALHRKGTDNTSTSGNILITGGRGSGKTVLATDLIKVIQKSGKHSGGKVGKITGESLNNKELSQLLKKVAGGYLIVEKAGDISKKTATALSLLMEQNTDGLLVIMEDTSRGIEKLLSLDMNFAKKFTERIKIPIFTSDELVEFAKAYAQEQECEIDDMGILALYNRISNIQKLDEATTLTEVKEIVDEAIARAERGGLKKIFGGKKFNSDGYLYLREKDFED